MYQFLLTLLLLMALYYGGRLLFRLARRRFYAHVRRMMGLPPEQKPAEKRRREGRRRKESGWRHFTRHAKIIPPEYAEDADYVVIKESLHRESHAEQSSQAGTVVEDQVSDADYEIISK